MNPEDHNPWQSSTSQGNPYVAQTNQQQSYNQYNQPPQQGQSYSGAAQGFHQNSQQQQQQSFEQYQPPPGPPGPPASAQGIQRSDTDTLLAQQNDRAEQIEHMQNYEATAQETQDDKDQAQLQKEFPDVDSSLIAALYGDTKDLSATREMLQELGRN